jgi:hypothetical protein
MDLVLSLSRWLGLAAPKRVGRRAGRRVRVQGVVEGGSPVRSVFSKREACAFLVQIGPLEVIRARGAALGERIRVFDSRTILESVRVRVDDGVIEVSGEPRLSAPGVNGSGDAVESAEHRSEILRWASERSGVIDATVLLKWLERSALHYRELPLGPGDPVELIAHLSPCEPQGAGYRAAPAAGGPVSWRTRGDLGPIELIDLTFTPGTNGLPKE